ncbi:hypothetical protein [Blastococcus mobilis]|uniref:Uncharacterized protein n=1 Tax=Blastococcus mobilis TaxID=1938746 RepID=A0A238XBV7_9ACTN|nr:hypothetical protein [Blastococcus mobilis]SNR56180.1 hypothetical protein SAMN06272737_112140 [Blastococcus mobilis]
MAAIQESFALTRWPARSSPWVTIETATSSASAKPMLTGSVIRRTVPR